MGIVANESVTRTRCAILTIRCRCREVVVATAIPIHFQGTEASTTTVINIAFDADVLISRITRILLTLVARTGVVVGTPAIPKQVQGHSALHLKSEDSAFVADEGIARRLSGLHRLVVRTGEIVVATAIPPQLQHVEKMIRVLDHVTIYSNVLITGVFRIVEALFV